MSCPSCQSKLPEDARFCAYCGITLRSCPQCARLFGDDDACFCGTCGTPLESATVRGPANGRVVAAPSLSSMPTLTNGLSEPKIIVDIDQILNADDNEAIFGYLYELKSDPNQHRLLFGDTKLGAGNNNDIIIDRSAVSWNHALFICRNERILLQDSASTNGTFVNGKRIRSPRQLRHGDSVRFGDAEFKVWLKSAYRELD
ncbi:MAG: FHA domain-containing protein [Bradymonadaceae bacterium]|nr:FHA domain-containing protein [Lujinxingiaceae bacterium]